MSKVIKFTGITKLDLPVDRVLDAAKETLDGVVIMGYTTDGEEYFASTYAHASFSSALAAAATRAAKRSSTSGVANT